MHACHLLDNAHSAEEAPVRTGSGGKETWWTEGRITNAACHMVKQSWFTTDRVPHQQHGVGAPECQVWEWDQAPDLVWASFLATAADCVRPEAYMRHLIVTGGHAHHDCTVRWDWSWSRIRCIHKNRDGQNCAWNLFFLKNPSLLFFATAMIYSAVTSWSPQLFLLAGRGPALSALCHLSNLQQSTTPWEKKCQQPKNDWEVKGEMWYVHAMLLS